MEKEVYVRALSASVVVTVYHYQAVVRRLVTLTSRVR